jgi:hypothetical protein
MCLAIYKPQNKKVIKHEMETAWESNDDGAGFAYPYKGKVLIEKGFMTFDSFWNAIQPHMDKPMAIHFRWSTHGLVDSTNCHPFAITDELAMIHNGVISGIDITDKDKSDTRTFVDDYIKPIHKGDKKFIYSDYGKRTLQACIGSGSKLVFIDKKANYVIVNEEAGEWQEGIWYSNNSHKELKVRYSTFTNGYAYSPYNSAYGSPYKPKATKNDVLGKRKKVKSKKKQWLPKSERKVEQTRLHQSQLELTTSTQGMLKEGITPKQPNGTLKPVEDIVDDTIGTFLPLL